MTVGQVFASARRQLWKLAVQFLGSLSARHSGYVRVQQHSRSALSYGAVPDLQHFIVEFLWRSALALYHFLAAMRVILDWWGYKGRLFCYFLPMEPLGWGEKGGLQEGARLRARAR